MPEKQLFISVTTFGQLFNFFVTLASVTVAVNAFFDLDHRLREMTQFEDNIGVVVDIISGVAAIAVAYYSIITPYDAIEIVTTADENFRTVLYMICLHMAGQSEIVDDPAIVFSGVFDQASNAADFLEEGISNETFFDPDQTNPTFFQSFDFELIESLTSLFLNAIYMSKVWLTIAGVVYSAYVIRAHYPLCDTQCIRIFAFTFLGRLPAIIGTVFALTMYFYNYNVDTVERFANAVWSETEALNADLPLVTVFETVGVIALGLKIMYILIFWGRYDFSLIGTTFLLGKSIIKADLQLKEDETFDGLVYTFMFIASMTIGPLLLNLFSTKIEDVSYFISKVLYKFGLLLMMISFVFILSSYTVDWFDFKFDRIQIGADIIAKLDEVTATIDEVEEQLFNVVRKLNPCIRRNPNFPTEVITDDNVFNPIGTTSQIDENLKAERKKMFQRGDDNSLCIDGNTFDFFNPLPAGNTCAKLKADQDEMRQRMQEDGIDATVFPETNYEEADFDNDKFIENAACKAIQCQIMTGVSAAALVVAAIPFAGYAGTMMNLGQRAAFTVFRIGRKIAKFGPRIKKKKDKFKKLKKVIRTAGTNSVGKMRFTAAMAGIYLPAFICIVVAFAVIMFRRDIYLSTNNRGSYTVLRNDKKRGLQNSFKMMVTIFLPMLIVNAAFTAMIYIVPEFLFEVLDLISRTKIVIASGSELPGYTALKMTYLLTTLGSACVCLSAFLFMFAGSFVYFFTYVKEKIFSAGVRRETKPTDYPPGISKYWYPIYWFADKVLNINTQYLQPVIFSLPVVYIVFDAFINDKDYFSLEYGAGPDMADLKDKLGEGIANRERSEATAQELDNNFCGIVGELVSAIADVALEAVTTLMSGFAKDIEEAFEGLSSFIDSLDAFSLNFFKPFDLKSINFIGTFLLNCLIYGIPIGCTGVLIGAWVMSQFYLPDKNTLLYLCSGIFVASVANLIIHSAVGNIFQLLADFKVPLFQFNLVLGRDYFNTQVCSVFNLASVIVTILNYVSPIPQFSLDGLYGDNKNEWVATYDVSPTEPKKEAPTVTPEVTPAETEGKYAF